MICSLCGAEGRGRKAFTVWSVSNGVAHIQCQACKGMLYAGQPTNEADPDVTDQGGHEDEPTEVVDREIVKRLDRIVELLGQINERLRL